MKLNEFDYTLPPEQIASHPLSQRTASRLMHIHSHGTVHHRAFKDLLTLLKEGDVLVFNNTQVIPARLFGKKDTGGRIELLIERLLDAHTARVHIKASKAPKPAQTIHLEDGSSLRVLGRSDMLFDVSFAEDALKTLQRLGQMPLPPYIKRPATHDDATRYQTVYAKTPGAVAAPTAGLHFDHTLLENLKQRGILCTEVTLHVGAGTFQPVRTENIEDHTMHREWLNVSSETYHAVSTAHKEGRRVIAVGTTSVRALETAAAQAGGFAPFTGDSQLFIYPGYKFKTIDGLITNFHLPQSTLLMLVSALAGKEVILGAYQQAIDAQYRFFSYGDAMFIENPCKPVNKDPLTHEV